ncbi:MAG TPA: exosome complex RNA-binding protein Csl4 [Thermoplasmata archaeon]|nr:exosome complex RNA-binding protein Csl4 [Thermoplasmata archaeon]
MSESSLPNLVVPGELLGTAEEFVPGHGTYEDHGKIYAALLGRPRVNSTERQILVDALHAIPRIADEDLVYARVDEVKSAMAICTIVAAADSRRAVPGAPEGTVHISKAKDGYTDSLGDEFQAGDLLIARVLQSQPTIKLTTAAPELGVLSARCSVCHGLLTVGPKDLQCPRCGNTERRKTAKGYGSGERPSGGHGGRSH